MSIVPVPTLLILFKKLKKKKTEPNLVPWVLRKIFSLEMVKNYICLRRASKQNAPFSEYFPQKNAPMLLMSRIGSEIWRKLKNLMKNDIPNIPNYFHIYNPNLL